MVDYYLKPFQERAISVFMDKFGIDAGAEVISIFEKTGSLGKSMIAYCHSLRTKEKHNQPLDLTAKSSGKSA